MPYRISWYDIQLDGNAYQGLAEFCHRRAILTKSVLLMSNNMPSCTQAVPLTHTFEIDSLFSIQIICAGGSQHGRLSAPLSGTAHKSTSGAGGCCGYSTATPVCLPSRGYHPIGLAHRQSGEFAAVMLISRLGCRIFPVLP